MLDNFHTSDQYLKLFIISIIIKMMREKLWEVFFWLKLLKKSSFIRTFHYNDFLHNKWLVTKRHFDTFLEISNDFTLLINYHLTIVNFLIIQRRDSTRLCFFTAIHWRRFKRWISHRFNFNSHRSYAYAPIINACTIIPCTRHYN